MCYSGRCEFERDGKECRLCDKREYTKTHHCSPCIIGGYYNVRDIGWVESSSYIRLNDIKGVHL